MDFSGGLEHLRQGELLAQRLPPVAARKTGADAVCVARLASYARMLNSDFQTKVRHLVARSPSAYRPRGALGVCG